MLARITGEGNRSGEDQEQKLLGEKKVNCWKKLVTEPFHLLLEASNTCDIWRKNGNKKA